MAANEEKMTNNEELLQLAIKAARSGQKDGARVMFRQVYARDKRNERAMIWLAKLSNDENERQQWLKRVLQINPDNEAAKSALSKMKHKRAASDNQTILLFGAVAVVMLVIVLAVVILAVAL